MALRFRASFVDSLLSHSLFGIVAVAAFTGCGDGTDTDTDTDTDTETETETDTDTEPDPDPICGDGTVDDGEECDDGGNETGDGCSAACSIEEPDPGPFCGDGTIDPDEECDDGNTTDDDGCSASCLIELPDPDPFCGDGTIDPDEECDDGNTTDGDGCSASCIIEPFCGDGTLDPDESCDDGNLDDDDLCPSTCEPAACGDGFVQAGVETCDDGGFDPADGCGPTCRAEVLPYFEDFDDGAHELTLTTSSATVLWHVTDTSSASSPNSLNFADPATNNYDDEAQVIGGAETTYFLIPPGGATVSFSIRKDTEEDAGYDQFSARVLDATDLVISEREISGAFSTFEVVSFSIPASASGTYARVQLTFDSVDELFNGTTGVFIDDLLVDLGECGDGATNTGEDCDDADLDDDDGCPNTCLLVCASGTGASAATLDAASGHCYARFDTPGDFAAAQTTCEGIGGDLVSIASATENTLVLGLYPEDDGDTLLIGATDAMTEGVFAWSSGDAFSYTNWSPTEPNDFESGEDCTELLSSGSWNDIACATEKGFVCELP